MYEHKRQPLAPVAIYYKRLFVNFLYMIFFLSICLCAGTIGYHYIAHAEWIDAFHNASMILAGMGPVIDISSVSGKLFSSFYALFSGVAFITNIGFFMAPAVHRFFHRLHVEEG
ncbi:MAG TPA: hypothetical protein VN958_04285 [Chitinophagaceae bacterium]|nr:hypothetical protein [Chitinophagaceae bacterium]